MTNSVPSFMDFYVSGRYASCIREYRTGGSSPIHMAEFDQPAGDFSDPGTSDFLLGRVLRAGFRAKCDFGPGSFVARPDTNALWIQAPMTPAAIEVDAPNQVRTFVFSSSQMNPILNELHPGDPFEFGGLQTGFFADPFILALVDRMWEEARQADPVGQLFTDAATVAIASALCRAAGRKSLPSRGGLAAWQLKRVTEYLAGHLTEDVTLAQLAAVAHLSPAHFCRAFKQATGRSPFQHLIAMRVVRGKELLSNTRLPVIEVAAACGYSSPARFSQIFRRETGATPSEWRRWR